MLFKTPIRDDDIPIVFQTGRPIPFSIINEGTFNKTWQPWRDRYFALRQDSTLVYRKRKDTPIIKLLDLKNTKISKMAIEASPNPLLLNDIGITVTCLYNGLETTFRCILDEWELHSFFEAINTYVINPTLPSIESEAVLLNQHKKDLKKKKEKIDDEMNAAYDDQSYMRQSLTRAMDKYEHKTKYERILYHRGSMQCLPIFFDNDLIHGSWWFVFGSFLTIVFSSIILANSYYPHSIIGLSTGMNNNNNNNSKSNTNHSTNNGGDGELNGQLYQTVWICMIISGIFFFLGSLSFVRAMFVTPPMKPLFSSWYHISSDELVGSWCFLLGCLPFIPYCMVYFITQLTVLYFVLLMVSFIVSIGAFVFVLSCYPGYKARRNYILPAAQLLRLHQCCVSEKTLRKHLYNDWLAGTWIMFWGTFIACIGCIVLTVQGVKQHNSLKVFMYATGLIQLFCFLLGSAYFVAGSYPPAALTLDDCTTSGVTNHSSSSGSSSGGSGISEKMDIESNHHHHHHRSNSDNNSGSNSRVVNSGNIHQNFNSEFNSSSSSNNNNSSSSNSSSSSSSSSRGIPRIDNDYSSSNSNRSNTAKVAHTNMDSDDDDDGEILLIKNAAAKSSANNNNSSSSSSSSKNSYTNATTTTSTSTKMNDKVKYNDVLLSSPARVEVDMMTMMMNRTSAVRRDSEGSHTSNGSGSFAVDVVLNPLNTNNNNNSSSSSSSSGSNSNSYNNKSSNNNNITNNQNTTTPTTTHTLLLSTARSDDTVEEVKEEGGEQ